MPSFAPVFNLSCNIWRPPATDLDPPTMTINCQLYWPSKGLFDVTPADPSLWVPPLYLRVQALTDIRPMDEVECPAGSGRLYNIRFVDDMHKGFPNEYRAGVLEQIFQPFPLP